MAALDSCKVQLVQHLAPSVTHTLSLSVPVTGSPIEYHLCFDTSANCHIGRKRVHLSSEPDSSSSAAVLCKCLIHSSKISSLTVSDCHPNHIELQGVRSNVYVKGTSWTGNINLSHSPEATRFQLRPNDLFSIDDTEVMIRVCGMDLPEPSATVESLLMPHPISSPPPSPPSRLERRSTILETPSKDPGTAKINNALVSNAIGGREDSHDWPADILKRDTHSSIREAKQLNRSSSIPAAEQQKLPASDVTSSKIVCQDSIDPRNPVLQRSSQYETECSQSSAAPAESHTHTRVKDESQESNIRHADALLAITHNDEHSSSLSKENNPAATAAAAEDNTEDHTMLDLDNTASGVPDLGASMPPIEPNVSKRGAMRVQRCSDNANNHESELKDHQASSQNPRTKLNGVQWGPGMNDSPERSPKRVKFSQNHDLIATAAVSSKYDADATTDDDEAESDSAVHAAEVSATADDAVHERLEKTPLASLDENSKGLNSRTEETSLSAPHDGASNSVKPKSPSIRKKAAVKKATVPQKTPKQQTPLSRKSLETPETPIEPSSSSRNTRSTARDSSSKLQESLSKTRVLFASSTTLDTSRAFMKFLTSHGVQKAKSIDDCTILCVGKEAELKRTSNLILAVLNGKDVITDTWISESVNAKALLDLEEYKATDPPREDEWGTSLTDAIARGKEGLRPFVDWSFCFTPTVRTELGKGLDDMKSICLKGGAKSIQATLPRKGPQEPCRTIMVASNGDDKDFEALHRNGWKVYSKDIITLSILRGSLQLESEEFVIQGKSPQAGKSKKRKR